MKSKIKAATDARFKAQMSYCSKFDWDEFPYQRKIKRVDESGKPIDEPFSKALAAYLEKFTGSEYERKINEIYSEALKPENRPHVGFMAFMEELSDKEAESLHALWEIEYWRELEGIPFPGGEEPDVYPPNAGILNTEDGPAPEGFFVDPQQAEHEQPRVILDRNERMVLNHLAKSKNKNTPEKQVDIATDLGRTEKTIRPALRRLEDIKAICKPIGKTKGYMITKYGETLLTPQP